MKNDVELRELMLAGMALFALFVVLNVVYRMYGTQILSQLPLEGNALQQLRQLIEVKLQTL